ncbi:hypothetical protein TL16_g03156 [Triparma laevis f. inornata]|uniref:Uncharacterized protein n=1 Tax=Triparma laevis f. inornata TaxID=1714386 RepID=A0A9W7DY84_9STRA|nr:hypothetical protein TL16_g03156 [Triparma laevis f. inornata]
MSVPYFEAVHFVRKALLIFFLTVTGYFRAELASSGVEASLLQAVLSLLVNPGFFIVLCKTKPLVYFPCSFLKNHNLNNFAELLGAGATVAGNIIAVIGTFSPNNQQLINILGTTFAIVNLTFVTIFLYGFYVDTRKTRKDKQALLSSQSSLEDGRATSPWLLKKELEKVEKKWQGEEIGGEDESNLKIVFGEYRALLDRMNAAISNHTGKALAEFEGLGEIAKNKELGFCKKILASIEKEATLNPMQVQSVQVQSA